MRRKRNGALLLIGALSGLLSAGLALGQDVDDLLEAEANRIRQAQQAQDQIDEIANETRSLFDEYQRVLKDIDSLVVYNTVQENLIADQERELADLRRNIDRVTVIERQILPLMTRMIAGLERFVSLDMPFFEERRLARVEELRQLINRSDVTTAEKFREVMEAWQIEMDYGSSTEAYTAELVLDGVTREVDFLRVGRVAWMYLTPNGQQAGVWDRESESWQPLGDEYLDEIRLGLRIARQQTTPELFMIPVPSPEEG